jgi:hypothetical protein
MFPWEEYDFINDGSAIHKSKFGSQTLDKSSVEKLWGKWYKYIIDPYKINKFKKQSMYTSTIENLPGLKVMCDYSTNRNQTSAICLTIREIIGLYLISFDNNMSIHKENFIKNIKEINKLLSIDGLEQIYDCITEYVIKKCLLKNNNKTNMWVYYDSTINNLNNKKHKFEKIETESIITKIKMLGSFMYDSLKSYDNMLYYYLEPKYPDRHAINERFYKWTINRKQKL